MQEFRELVNDVFLEPESESSHGEQILVRVQDSVRAIHDLVARVHAATQMVCPSVKQLQQQRREHIQREVDSVMSLNETLPCCGLNAVSNDTKSAVSSVIRTLRHLEQSREFHRDLLRAQRQAAVGSSYSMDNFAYGSTPFYTWLALVQTKSVSKAIVECQEHQRDGLTPYQYAVCGSSTGSLVFFAAVLFGIESVGVEILPYLWKVSKDVQRGLQSPNRCCRFVCEDMLQSSLSRIKILVLTSQCWDHDLHDRVLVKLERELPVGSIVIDYKDRLRKSRCFQLVEHVEELQVSWNKRQSFFIFQCILMET